MAEAGADRGGGAAGLGLRAPHLFWQEIELAGTHATAPAGGHHGHFPAALPDGRQLLLPIRALPQRPGFGVASLIVNQASFAVHDALVAQMTALATPLAPEVVVAVPTLGLSLGRDVARALGHPRHVPLGTSAKFWYVVALSEPMASITSPSAGKRLYVDPRMLPLLAGRRVLVVDDVVSTGTSLAAVLRLLAKVEVQPIGVAVAMVQTRRWRETLADIWPAEPLGVLHTPLLAQGDDGGWRPA
jgi:adenine/guanine phosphoribosyltransferase-like PRPP-binding protein